MEVILEPESECDFIQYEGRWLSNSVESLSVKNNTVILFGSLANEDETVVPVSVIGVNFNAHFESFSGFIILFQGFEDVPEFHPDHGRSRDYIDRLFDGVPCDFPTLE